MAAIKSTTAYFRAVVRNSYKNEYRANDNQSKHIVVDSRLTEKEGQVYLLESVLDRHWEKSGVDAWLETIENQKLLKALRMLKPKELEFVYAISANRYSTYEMAEYLGRSQSSTAQRYLRIKNKIKI